MFVTRFLSVLVLTGATLIAPGLGRADTMPAGATQTAKPASTNTRLEALSQGVREIDSRSRAVRDMIVREPDQRVRRHSRRAMAVVDENRISIAARLDLFQVVATAQVDEPTLRNMELRYTDSIKVLKVVENWLQKPQGPNKSKAKKSRKDQ
ncbi:hypothetical protein LZC95_04270 [Pendulispora brunnea]|uniref:Uncharacterized protein n=1 Tax=Pendulispora brunnea TaxID=2905690 RepID=A0ABZ2KGK3_9BACT